MTASDLSEPSILSIWVMTAMMSGGSRPPGVGVGCCEAIRRLRHRFVKNMEDVGNEETIVI